jgi:leucyl/phenylalanyl-tRNA--protein transferase
LVGGLYGVAIGKMYFGESMFAWDDDASKIGFVVLCRQLQRWGFDLVDSQVYTDHLARFGAVEIERSSYLELLGSRVKHGRQVSEWKIDGDLATLDGIV